MSGTAGNGAIVSNRVPYPAVSGRQCFVCLADRAANSEGVLSSRWPRTWTRCFAPLSRVPARTVSRDSLLKYTTRSSMGTARASPFHLKHRLSNLAPLNIASASFPASLFPVSCEFQSVGGRGGLSCLGECVRGTGVFVNLFNDYKIAYYMIFTVSLGISKRYNSGKEGKLVDYELNLIL